MAFLSTTVAWDTIRSITHPKVAQKIADNITAKIPLIYFLNRLGHKEHENGGFNYVLPVFKEVPSAQAYTGNSTLTAAEADPGTVAIYERKQLTVPIVATGTKMLQNSGSNPEAIVNYMEFMVEQAQEGIKQGLADRTTGIMSANAETDTGVTGLQNILPDSTTTGVAGGLSRVTYAFWRHQTNSVATGFNTDGLPSMNSLYFDCVRGDESPTVIIMTQAGYVNFLRSLTGTINFNQPSGGQQGSPATSDADIGFPHTKFYGTPVTFDAYTPDNRAYFLSLKYMKLLVHSERDMSIRDYITPTDQDSLLARIYWAGNLVCNNLSRQGLLQGLIETWA